MLCGLFMEYLVAECWFGPYMSALQSSLPPRVRGLGISVMMFSATFFGSLMSYAIGEWYDGKSGAFSIAPTATAATAATTSLLRPPPLLRIVPLVPSNPSPHSPPTPGCCGGSGAYIRYIVLYAVLGTYLTSAVGFYWASTIDDEPVVTERKPLLADEEA